MIQNNLSLNLKTLIQAREDLNEAKLSRELNIPQPTLHRLINGATSNPTVMTLLPIVEYFKVSLDQLFGLEPLDIDSGTFQSRKSFQIPIIPWEEVHNCASFVSGLTSKTWSDWITTNLKLTQEAFALQIISQTMPTPYEHGSVQIIEPSDSIRDADGKSVVIYSKKTNAAYIRAVVIEGETIWLAPINKRLMAEKFEDPLLFCGIIRQHILTVNTKDQR